ncbi:hypothetical protein NXV57_25520 [Bacteroides thetaiotaomicron]|nr:hypothetical protein [Bacteroides thetaiotaomicron]
MVNTKKGLSGKIQITGRFNTTLSVLNRLPKYLGAYEYAQLANEARAVRNETPLYDDTEMGIIRDGLDPDLYPNVNWQDEILNKTFWRHTYYVSGRGGSDVARYFLSLGGKNESAAYKVDKNSIYSSNVSYNTYNYRINLDVNLTKSTKVYLGSDGFLSQLNQPGVANTEYIWGSTVAAYSIVHSHPIFQWYAARTRCRRAVIALCHDQPYGKGCQRSVQGQINFGNQSGLFRIDQRA